ncbi:MAG: hypothetical protein PHE50_02110 [Dehalococcoidales bacterium]|nr:hypothetical protein [Dehalococcoidales bacterium]
MTKKHLFFIALAILALLFLVGCAAGPNPSIKTVDAAGKIAGFWTGLWHGVISPVTFIISLFTKNVNLYDVFNNGNWYNFGFILGVSIIFGGGAAGSASRRHWYK